MQGREAIRVLRAWAAVRARRGGEEGPSTRGAVLSESLQRWERRGLRDIWNCSGAVQIPKRTSRAYPRAYIGEDEEGCRLLGVSRVSHPE